MVSSLPVCLVEVLFSNGVHGGCVDPRQGVYHPLVYVLSVTEWELTFCLHRFKHLGRIIKHHESEEVLRKQVAFVSPSARSRG